MTAHRNAIFDIGPIGMTGLLHAPPDMSASGEPGDVMAERWDHVVRRGNDVPGSTAVTTSLTGRCRGPLPIIRAWIS